MTRLDVFDFSTAGVTLTSGARRAGGEPGEFNGSVNGLIDNGGVDLGRFAYDNTVPYGQVSLGDGGSIAFDLTRDVQTNGPLYLYVAEEGGAEPLTGKISASSDFVEPTGDLSTDLGTAGLQGDATKLTYVFTPKAGDTAFSFDAVLFSEELPEFDGTDLTDIFSIKLNGVDIGSLSNGAALTIKNLVYSGSNDLVYNLPGSGPLADQIRADAYTHALTDQRRAQPGRSSTR